MSKPLSLRDKVAIATFVIMGLSVFFSALIWIFVICNKYENRIRETESRQNNTDERIEKIDQFIKEWQRN